MSRACLCRAAAAALHVCGVTVTFPSSCGDRQSSTCLVGASVGESLGQRFADLAGVWSLAVFLVINMNPGRGCDAIDFDLWCGEKMEDVWTW